MPGRHTPRAGSLGGADCGVRGRGAAIITCATAGEDRAGCGNWHRAAGGVAPGSTPVLTGRRGPDFNLLDLGGEGGLLGCLEQVADHRKPKGRRHGLAAILAVVVVARLSGANSVYAAGQSAATMPQEALRRRGIRYSTGSAGTCRRAEDDQAGSAARRREGRR